MHHGVILHLDLVDLRHLLEILVQFLLKRRIRGPPHRVHAIGQTLRLSLKADRGGRFEFVDIEEEEVVHVPASRQDYQL